MPAEIGKAQQAQQLLALSERLRRSAAETTDPEYIRLFHEAAAALDARARRITEADPKADPKADPSGHLDIKC